MTVSIPPAEIPKTVPEGNMDMVGLVGLDFQFCVAAMHVKAAPGLFLPSEGLPTGQAGPIGRTEGTGDMCRQGLDDSLSGSRIGNRRPRIRYQRSQQFRRCIRAIRFLGV